MRFAAVVFALVLPVMAMDIAGIRDWYGTVHEMMGGEDMYRSSLEINPDEVSYPGTGIYHKTISFYWGLSEDHSEQALFFITETAWYAAVREYREYLFDRSGNLLFCFVSGGYEMTEKRYYFSDDELIQFTVNGEKMENLQTFSSEAGSVLQNAENYSQAFMMIH